MKTLVIVESPTKAKTLAKFLGSHFRVESSMGHVRDLPKSKMGIDIDGGTFLPDYEIPPTKKKKVTELKKLAKDVDEILFATDEDREGEAISWHLAELLKVPETKVKRLVFHEITKEAILHAIETPRPLNRHLVDAQQARRVLDRLVGYELSPLLWRKVRYGLSAGRVQSVAVHLIVLREQERARFLTGSYYDVLATLQAEGGHFEARLIAVQDKAIPSGKDFDAATGKLKQPEKFALLSAAQAEALAVELMVARPWTVTDVTSTPYESHPYPPFITSTLQQESSRKLGLSAKQTMRTAQALYENGYITYMRTDSVHLSEQALAAARAAAEEFGKEYVAAEPKQYATQSASAQEAHEAIRPAGATFRHPSDVRAEVSSDEARLYDLIWKRTVASQMRNARMITMTVTIDVAAARFEAKGKRIEFAGFLRAYVEGADDPEAVLEDKEVVLPALQPKQLLEPSAVIPESHATQPPARYTEASLIKKLEHEGVGRPSTYATILDTIMAREYVLKQGSALVPTYTAMIVDGYLVEHVAPLLDVHFTSTMEQDLDRIALGTEAWQPYLRNFYHNETGFSFHTEVTKAAANDQYPKMLLGNDPVTGKPLFVKSGKYGPYIQRDEGGEGNTCSIPDAIAPADLTIAEAVTLLAAPSGPQVLTTDLVTGKEITFRTGRFGPYLQVGEDEEGKKAKKVALTYGPKHTPISSTLDIQQLTVEGARQVAGLPRPLGEIDGLVVVASVGRFGPYVKRGDEFRSVNKDYDILTITLADATALFAQPKKASRRISATVLRELGPEPSTQKPVQILDGRYGPYIADGTKIFVSIPKDVPIADVTLAQALTWIAEKKGKSVPKRRKKKSAVVET